MKRYTEEDYKPIVEGEIPLPNFEPVTAQYFCDALASGGHSMIPKWGHSKSEDGRRKVWAQYFLTNFSNMGNEPDGSGYVCVYGGRIGRFAICKHEKKLGAGAVPSRGWNPGTCIKCGLDMTIDSGD
jgi:hypothetical protein